MKKSLEAVEWLIILTVIGMWMRYFPMLPDRIPIHWDFAGHPDNYGWKRNVSILSPSLLILLALLFRFLPRLDPKAESYRAFDREWRIYQLAIVAFFGFIQWVMIRGALEPGIDVGRWVIGGLGALFFVLGKYMGAIKRNYFVGVKLPWTLESDAVWDATHRFSGIVFMSAGALLGMCALTGRTSAILVLILIALMVILPIVYSFLLYRRGTR